MVLEPHQGRLAVLGVDHRARELPVEPVDGARRKRPLGARGVGLASGVERDGRLAVGGDRQHLRGREVVRRDLQVDLVHDRVRVAEVRRRPLLVLLVAQRVLLAQPGSRRAVPLLVLRLGRERLRDRQLVLERVQDQRAGRERLDVEQQVADRGRGRGEHPVRRPQALVLQRRHHESLRGGQAQPDSTDRPDPQYGAPTDPPFFLVPLVDHVCFWHVCSHVLSPGCVAGPSVKALPRPQSSGTDIAENLGTRHRSEPPVPKSGPASYPSAARGWWVAARSGRCF